MRVALYVRVSTAEQTVKNQEAVLSAVADKRGWTIVGVYRDEAISGAKGRDKRPGFDRLWKDAARRKFDLIASWSVDKLGRSLADVAAFMVDMRAYGVDLYLDKQAVDTTTPSGRALLQVAGVFAEWEREMIRERTIAGQARARAAGVRFGRRRFHRTRRRRSLLASSRASASSSWRRSTGSASGRSSGSRSSLLHSPSREGLQRGRAV